MRNIVNHAAAFVLLQAIALLCCHGVSTSIPRTTEFETAQELRDFAISSGLMFHCGNGSGFVYNNYFLADHPIAFDDLAGVSTRRDCGLSPAWRGVLWVCPLGTLGPDPYLIGGKWRVWGNVLVAGDELLMDRIEDLYRSNPGDSRRWK
jgi:hypothetical protein